jgi:L-cysteine/cystine lyase
VAATLVADPADIALTHSTTDGMNLAISSLPWAAGDRVVTSNHEHPGGLGPLLAARARHGIELAFADIGAGGDDEVTLASLARALDGGARAVMVSHVLWTTGAVLPIARIAALAREAGAVTIVDGAQGAGAVAFGIEDLGVDAYALPAQKWLLGPEGMGALWASRTFADGVVPPAAGGLSYATFDRDAPVLHRGARRFEATTFHRPSLIGFARSLGWLAMYVGLPWARDRATRLAAGAAERLGSIPNVEVITPRSRMGTLVTFRISGWPAPAAVEELGQRAFAIVREVASLDAIRISVGFWNTDAELDRFANVVERRAAHGPDALPPLRRLAILDGDGRPLA